MSDQNKQLNIIEPAYLYKKTEKLVLALYLLSSFISDKEPVKWQLREVSLKLLSQMLPLSDKPIQGVSLLSLTLSYLEVAYMGGLISEMNFNIFKFELETLINKVEQEEKDQMKGAVLSEHFFNVPDVSPTTVFEGAKGHNSVSDRMSFRKETVSVRPIEHKQKDKSNRQDIIIALLQKGNELGIKDFTSAIKDCSEKTIQRELVSLVSKGLVKKQGEKRWSRYMLG